MADPLWRLLAGALLLCLPRQDTGAPPLDTALIPTGAWTYEFWEGEIQVGDLISVVHRQQDLLVSSSFLSRPTGRQEGTVTVSASDLVPIHSHVILVEGAGAFEARMRYEADSESLRVERTVVRQAFPPSQALPPLTSWTLPLGGRFDMQELDMVVQALPLSGGAEWQTSVVDPTVDHPVSVRIRVEGRDTVTVPAGAFEVWRVRVRGLVADMIYEIGVTDRRLVAQYAPAQGIRMLLKR